MSKRKKWSPATGDWTDTDFLVCRDLQHAWTPQTAKPDGKGYLRRMRCMRCGSWKEQTLDRYGYITGSKITYAEGYLMPKGGGRLSKNDRALLRLEMWERA